MVFGRNGDKAPSHETGDGKKATRYLKLGGAVLVASLFSAAATVGIIQIGDREVKITVTVDGQPATGISVNNKGADSIVQIPGDDVQIGVPKSENSHSTTLVFRRDAFGNPFDSTTPVQNFDDGELVLRGGDVTDWYKTPQG